MRPKEIVITFLVLLHLSSVLVFIWADWPERSRRDIHIALRTYQNLSGTFRDYAFFAPSVGNDIKAGFLVEDSSGNSHVVNFISDNREVNFRYNCIILACMRDIRGRDLFAQSWSALVLGSNPDAKDVTVMVKEFAVPTMEEYGRGQRPSWELLYVGKFARSSSEPNQ